MAMHIYAHVRIFATFIMHMNILLRGSTKMDEDEHPPGLAGLTSPPLTRQWQRRPAAPGWIITMIQFISIKLNIELIPNPFRGVIKLFTHLLLWHLHHSESLLLTAENVVCN